MINNKFIKQLSISAACIILLSACANSPNPVPDNTELTEVTTAQAMTENTVITIPAETEPVYYDNIDAVLNKVAVSEENRFISAPVELFIEENKALCLLNVSYENYIDIYTLQHCKLDVDILEGEYSFSSNGVNADGTVNLTVQPDLIITDKSGKSKKYSVRLEREVFDLPIVNIYLEGFADKSTIDRNEYSRMDFFMDCSGNSEFESIPIVSGGIRGRGHSTWNWEKKPYRIKLDEKASLLGLDKNKDWILLSNYADKSLIRNCVAYDMGKELGSFVWNPSQYPVDLFLNGEYQGVYTLGEQREIAKSRIDIYESDTDADRGYLLEIGGASKDQLINNYGFFHTDKELANFVAFADPKPEDMTEEQQQFITDYVNKAEAAIVSGVGYEDYIDVESFCDWIIIHELTCNLDSCFRRSCYMTKDKGGKLEMGPIWDFDLAFGNYIADNQGYNSWFTLGSDRENAFVTVNWCNYLMNNKNFRSKIKERWFEIRDSLVQRANTSIDYYSEKVERSQAENFKVWDIMGKQVGYEGTLTAAITDYDSHIRYLKDFISKRAEWIDKNI